MPSLHLPLAADLAWPGLALIGLVVFLAGVLRGFTGFGFALAAVPVLTLFASPAAIVPAIFIIALLSGVEMLPRVWRLANFRAVGHLLSGALIGTPVGVYVLSVLPEAPMRLIIGAVLLLAVLLLWRGPGFKGEPSLPAKIGTGFLSGLLNGGTAMGGPPVVLYFLAAPEGVASGRASLLFYFFFTSIWAIVLLILQGVMTWPSLWLALALSPAMFLGNRLGESLFLKNGGRLYRRVALLFLAAIALLAIARALAAGW